MTRRYRYDVDRIEEKRLAKGWSRHQLGLAAGLSNKTITQILRGKSMPRSVAKVAAALGLDLADLVIPVEQETAAAGGISSNRDHQM